MAEAQNFLKHGFFVSVDAPDPRMGTGDSIHVQLGGHALRIQPHGSFWRNQIRNHDPNVRHMVYMRLAKSFTSWEDFDKEYMLISPPSAAELKKIYEPMKLDDGSVIETYFVYTDLDKLTPKLAQDYERKHELYRWLVFCNVLMSLSYHDQINSLSLFEDFENDRARAINYIYANLKRKVYHADPEKFPAVGHVKEGIVAPRGKVYKADVRGIMRDVTSIKLHPGQTLALLKHPHNRVNEIVAEVNTTMESNRMSKGRYENERTLINKALNKSEPNHVFQILKQSGVWYE
jgi:hypothetical protein